MALSFDGVSFQYRSKSRLRAGVPVFKDFTWAQPPGRTVLLGPNGAGKSTLLSLAATSLRPQAGVVRLDGVPPNGGTRALRQSTALMPQAVHPIPGLTAREQVAYAAWLQGANGREAVPDALAALDRVGLSNEADALVTSLSGGQLRRVGLAQVLVRPVRVLLLDEPTAGLDPAQRSRFRDLIADLPPDVPVLVSTHQVDDLTELFDSVVVLDHGVVRFQGSPEAFVSMAPDGSPRPAEAAYMALLGAES